jgi:hypothetical protein
MTRTAAPATTAAAPVARRVRVEVVLMTVLPIQGYQWTLMGRYSKVC